MTRRVLRAWIMAWLLCLVLAVTLALAGAPYHGNVKSHVFHQSTCRYYNCKNCVMEFQTREEAIKAGYRPCKVCNP